MGVVTAAVHEPRQVIPTQLSPHLSRSSCAQKTFFFAARILILTLHDSSSPLRVFVSAPLQCRPRQQLTTTHVSHAVPYRAVTLKAAAHHHARIARCLFFVQCRPRLTTLSSSMSVTTQQQRSGLHGRVGRPSPSPWLWTLTRLCASHQVRNTLKRYEEKKKKKTSVQSCFCFLCSRDPPAGFTWHC